MANFLHTYASVDAMAQAAPMTPPARSSAHTLILANVVTLVAALKRLSEIAMDVFDRNHAEKTCGENRIARRKRVGARSIFQRACHVHRKKNISSG